jgi:hypothetical protein
MISTHLCLGLSSGLLPFGFPTNIVKLVLNLRVPRSAGKPSSVQTTRDVSSSAQLHGVSRGILMNKFNDFLNFKLFFFFFFLLWISRRVVPWLYGVTYMLGTRTCRALPFCVEGGPNLSSSVSK